jgi:glycosyltransferase involved in cell wall biosynthesis
MKVLLLSDVTMCADAGGIYQTLYNVFSFLDPVNLLCVTPLDQFENHPPAEIFLPCYVTYNFELLTIPKNRLAKYVGPFVNWFNYSYSQNVDRFKSIKKKITSFDPDVIISCSNGTRGVFMHYKLLDGINVKDNVIPYFMDDWMYQSNLKWQGGQIHSLVKKLLENPYWLMISRELSDILKNRYHISPQKVLAVHNPVNLLDAPALSPLAKKQEYTLAYAGALWQMHFDSFCIIAKAVHAIQSVIKINLIWYTTPDFWEWRKAKLEPLGVQYGGSIPYSNIHNVLSEADALILCSSFSSEWITHSKGSIQTKITDYLKSRKLIISCGPTYSANHNFIKEHDCGICIETESADLVESSLINILNNIEDYQYKIDNGWKVLEKEFTFKAVHDKVNEFIATAVI